MNRLLVLVPDMVSAIVRKGEYQPRYYNPGDLFREVHLATTADDTVDPEALRSTAGTAALHFHSHPEDRQLPHKPWSEHGHQLLRDWAAPLVELARDIRPALIRCHGADWNTYAAARIKQELGIPYVVSLHINPDINPCRRHLGQHLSAEQWRENILFEYIERVGLAWADLVMPVYQPIIPYLERMGVRNYRVCYNVLSPLHLREKTDYRLHRPARLLCLGRLFADKNPANILRALADRPDTRLDIVGDGPLRPELQALAASLSLADRVRFLPAVANDALCRRLPDYDLFVIHTEYWECNKSLLEALLTGLPCLLNHRHGLPVPELDESFVMRVENTPQGYGRALDALLGDDVRREALGRAAFRHARAHWDPALTETRYAAIYREFARQEAVA